MSTEKNEIKEKVTTTFEAEARKWPELEHPFPADFLLFETVPSKKPMELSAAQWRFKIVDVLEQLPAEYPKFGEADDQAIRQTAKDTVNEPIFKCVLRVRDLIYKKLHPEVG